MPHGWDRERPQAPSQPPAAVDTSPLAFHRGALMRERLLSPEEVRPKPDTCAAKDGIALLPYAAREIISEFIARRNHAWIIERLGHPMLAQARAAGLRRAARRRPPRAAAAIEAPRRELGTGAPSQLPPEPGPSRPRRVSEVPARHRASQTLTYVQNLDHVWLEHLASGTPAAASRFLHLPKGASELG